MNKMRWSILVNTAYALILTIPLAAAGQTTARTTKDAMPSHSVGRAWPQETISGKITIVDPDRKLVVITLPDGVAFDIVVTAKTRIKLGSQAIDFKDLTQDINRIVSVKFTPDRRGDIAKLIQLNG